MGELRPIAVNMVQLHHASWHLLRKHKGKARTRHYSKARIGILERRMEEGFLRLRESEQRLKALYSGMQTASQEVSHG